MIGGIAAALALAGWACWSLAPAQGDGSRPIRTLKHSSAVFSVAWSPAGDQLAAGGILDHRVSVWDPRSGVLLRVLGDQPGVVTGLAYSPDGHWLVAGRGMVRLDPRRAVLTVWEARSGALLTTVPSAGPGSDRLHDVDQMAFSPDRRWLAAALGGWIRIYDPGTWTVAHTVSADGLIRSLAFSGDGRRLAAGNNLGVIRIWDTQGWAAVQSIAAHADGVKALAFSRDGRSLASGTSIGATIGRLDERRVLVRRVIDEPLRVFDVATGTLVRELPGHSGEIQALEYSPDGRHLGSGSRDRTVRFWDTATGRQVLMLTAPDLVMAIAFSPDGRRLAAGSGNAISIWEPSH